MFLLINCHKTLLLINLPSTLFDLNEEAALLPNPKSLFVLQLFIVEPLFARGSSRTKIRSPFWGTHETCLQKKLETFEHLNYTYVRFMHFKDFIFKVSEILSVDILVLQYPIYKFSSVQLAFRFKVPGSLNLHNQSRPHRRVPIQPTLLFIQVCKHFLVIMGQRFQWSYL